MSEPIPRIIGTLPAGSPAVDGGRQPRSQDCTVYNAGLGAR